MRVLTREFYAREPAVVASELVGKLLLRETSAGLCGGMIVECEAYLSRRDPACHASRGMTRRNVSMFGPPGHAYVYTIHTRWLLNAVTEPEGTPSAILIRAIEPRWGVDLMQQRRGTEVLRDLARGPGRLAQALAIDRTYDGWDLTAGKELWIAEEAVNGHPLRIARSGRIGISSAQRRLLRFYLSGNRFVSGRLRPATSRPGNAGAEARKLEG
jgi:DNA-3-methyladenine glycosylase